MHDHPEPEVLILACITPDAYRVHVLRPVCPSEAVGSLALEAQIHLLLDGTEDPDPRASRSVWCIPGSWVLPLLLRGPEEALEALAAQTEPLGHSCPCCAPEPAEA